MKKHIVSGIFVVACFVYSAPALYSPVVPPILTQQTDPNQFAPENQPPAKITDSSPTAPTEDSGLNQRDPMDTDKMIIENGQSFPLRTYEAVATPNDPSYNQWWLDNIDLANSWDIPAGSEPTLLAIIDTGFALNHEEFAGRWYTNSGESGSASTEAASDLNCSDQSLPLTASCNNIDDNEDGVNDNESTVATSIENPSRLNCSDQGRALTKDCNRIDDDGNGLVDDWRGWDYINHDASVQAGEMNPNGEGTHHGTYVAGAAAATGNNGVGMAGVDWNTNILPLQALDDDSYGHTLSVARSIRYAISQGADVISISLGSKLPDQYLRNVITEAVASGVIVVAASGNDGCDCMLYPARYSEVIAVGANDSSNQRASFSNFGATLDVVAPGTGVYTTNWTSANGTSAYASVNGTSISTPIVSGLLTRMRSHQPTATAQQLVAALSENTDRITLASTQHNNTAVGYGKINALRAMQRVTQPFSKVNATEFGYTNQGQSYEHLPLQARIYDCGVSGKRGTTPLYELTKTGSTIFTISEVERAALLLDGYTSSLFSFTCLNLPSDTFTESRSINVYQEFKNTSPKY